MENVLKAANESKFRTLRRFNVAMCLLHLAQAAAMFALSNDFSVTITTSFLKLLPGVEVPDTVTEGLYDIRLGPLVAVFLLISAIAHFIMESPF